MLNKVHCGMGGLVVLAEALYVESHQRLSRWLHALPDNGPSHIDSHCSGTPAWSPVGLYQQALIIAARYVIPDLEKRSGYRVVNWASFHMLLPQAQTLDAHAVDSNRAFDKRSCLVSLRGVESCTRIISPPCYHTGSLMRT